MGILEILAVGESRIDPGEIGLVNPATNGDALLLSVLNTVYFWSGIVAVIVIIAAGYLYTTSNSSASRMSRAKDAILYSIVGLAVILVAFTATQFILGNVG